MPLEISQWLQPEKATVLFDGTFGAGGHSVRLASQLPAGGRLIAVDRDPAAIAAAATVIGNLPITVVCDSYHRIDRVLDDLGIGQVDGVVLDLGLSSDQLADRERGFSFTSDGYLDLRFDPTSGPTAADFLASASEKEIADTIYQFGEERFSRRIAKQVVERRRQKQRVKTVADLVEICRRCVPRSKNHDIHPATRTFQALRIKVNEELAILADALNRIPGRLAPGGRLAVISFHSLEDRIVKNAFRDSPEWEVLTRKPLRPSDEEIEQNPRSRSAKLRVASCAVLGA